MSSTREPLLPCRYISKDAKAAERAAKLGRLIPIRSSVGVQQNAVEAAEVHLVPLPPHAWGGAADAHLVPLPPPLLDEEYDQPGDETPPASAAGDISEDNFQPQAPDDDLHHPDLRALQLASEHRIIGCMREIALSFNEVLKEGLGEVQAKYHVALLDVVEECTLKAHGLAFPARRLSIKTLKNSNCAFLSSEDWKPKLRMTCTETFNVFQDALFSQTRQVGTKRIW